MKQLIYLVLALASTSCNNQGEDRSAAGIFEGSAVPDISIDENTVDTFIYLDAYISTSFDFPVGKPDSKGYYNAQPFGQRMHLGDDWNAISGGNADLGDPVYAVADGYVSNAQDHFGSWGNVVRILHKLPSGKEVESLYAHCDTILCKQNEWVKRGEKIATIGTAHGVYLAHLHFEIRRVPNLPLGGGYSADTFGYLNPSQFIRSNR